MSGFASLSKLFSATEEERLCSELLFNDCQVQMGDQRLNNIAARTYNSESCKRIFTMLEKTLSPTENPWNTIHKALLILHTIVLFGSELAVDKSIQLCRFVYPLINYNSALVKKSWFSGGGGTDYGAPVRMVAKELNDILVTDDGIRNARSKARAGQESLVPMGEMFLQSSAQSAPSLTFGQGVQSSVGAGFDLSAVPGMYEGRPERYFDNQNDPRSRFGSNTIGDHQITRDAQAPSLLDLAFDSPANDTAALPPADYLPALERQKELEQQLAMQQEQLRKLQELQQQQAALQQQQMQQQQLMPPHQGATGNILDLYGPPSAAPVPSSTATPNNSMNSLLDLNAPAPSIIPASGTGTVGNNTAFIMMQHTPHIQQPQEQFGGMMMPNPAMNPSEGLMLYGNMGITPPAQQQYQQQPYNPMQFQQQVQYGQQQSTMQQHHISGTPMGPPPPVPSMPPPPIP